MKDNIILKKNTRTLSFIFILSSLAIYGLEFFVPKIVTLLIDSIKNFNVYMSIGLVFLLVSVRISSNLGNSISIALVKKRCNDIIKESNITLIKNISFSKHKFSLDLDNKKNVHQSIIDRLDALKSLLLGQLTLIGKTLHIIIMISVICVVNFKIGLIVSLSVGLSLFAFSKFYKNNAALENLIIKSRSSYFSQIFEGIRLFEGIRSVGAQYFFNTTTSRKLNNFIRADNLRIKSDFIATFLDAIFSNIVILVSLLSISIFSSFGEINIANAVTIFFLASTTSSLTSSLFTMYITFQRSKIRYDESRFSFDHRGAISDIPSLSNFSNRIESNSQIECVTLSNVKFKYDINKSSSISVNKLKFEIGSNTAVVGKSGGGKSTLGKLVGGIVKPVEGTVEYTYSNHNNETIESIDPKVVFVPQAPFLLPGSLRDNLLLGRSNVNDETIVDVLKDLSLFPGDEIDSSFLKMQVEKTNFSGGELQRLNIARAALQPSDIIILDEPSSALDLVSEVVISDFIRKKFDDRIVITIAHRMSSLQQCDSLVVVGNDDDVDFFKNYFPKLINNVSLVEGFI